MISKKQFLYVLCVIALIISIVVAAIETANYIKQYEDNKVDWSFPIPHDGKFVSATIVTLDTEGFVHPFHNLPYNCTGRSAIGTHIVIYVEYYENTPIVGTNVESTPTYIGAANYEFIVKAP